MVVGVKGSGSISDKHIEICMRHNRQSRSRNNNHCERRIKSLPKEKLES